MHTLIRPRMHLPVAIIFIFPPTRHKIPKPISSTAKLCCTAYIFSRDWKCHDIEQTTPTQQIIFASLVFLLGGGGRGREEPACGIGMVHVSGGGGGLALGKKTVCNNNNAYFIMMWCPPSPKTFLHNDLKALTFPIIFADYYNFNLYIATLKSHANISLTARSKCDFVRRCF